MRFRSWVVLRLLLGRSMVDAMVLPTAASPPPRAAALLVFSGGTAFNSVARTLGRATSNVTHVLPISDNGGSTREIARVVGGPAIGDIRSRLIRLSQEATAQGGDSQHPTRYVTQLLEHRLDASSSEQARAEFLSIVDGTHKLWGPVPEPYKQTVRAFLVHFYHTILQCASVAGRCEDVGGVFGGGGSQFDWRNGSVGNFVFTGARQFFQSLDAAIFWFSRLTGIPEDSVVVPVVASNERVSISARLVDGTTVVGQDAISHPRDVSWSRCTSANSLPDEDVASLDAGAELVEQLTTVVDKTGGGQVPMPAQVDELAYVNQQGSFVVPRVNGLALERLALCETVVYGMGSLFTSLVPCLAPRGVGKAIKSHPGRKILLLNGNHDRETMWLDREHCDVHCMSARDVLAVVQEYLNRNEGDEHEPGELADYVTDLVRVQGSPLCDDEEAAAVGELGIIVHTVPADTRGGTSPAASPTAAAEPALGCLKYDPAALVDVLLAITKRHRADGAACR